MSVGRSGKRIKLISAWDGLTRLVLLSVCFALGVLGGFLFANLGGGSVALRDYLLRWFQVSGQGSGAGPSLLSTVWEVFRWPLAVFLLGFTALGVVGIPALLLARGFLLSFAATTFARLFGMSGMAVSLAAFGVTLFLSVPVLFVTAQSAFRTSLDRLADPPVAVPIKTRFATLFPCVGLLVLAAALQRIVMPAVLTAVCARLFPV